MKKLFSYLLLLFFAAVICVPKAHAAVGSITLDPLHDAGGGNFYATGMWDVQGNQCWAGGSSFHYKINVIDLNDSNHILTTINPAPCNGDYTDDVDFSNRGTGGIWPAPIGPYNSGAQPEVPASFSVVGNHTICALLIHVNDNGNDRAKADSCIQTQPGPPHLVVFKHVENDNGGTNVASDFTMNVTGTNVSDSSFAGSETGVDITLDPGSFSVSETGPSGYSESDSAGCTGTIAAGETKTCTIVNDDIQPKLTLVKTVVNDNGGTLQIADFPLFVGTTGVTSGVATGFDAGTYTASETQQYGYAASAWGGDCAEDGTVTLGIGDNKTCTLTNDDIQPKLTVTKVVMNDNGGTKVVSDFPLFVGGTGVTSGAQNGFNAGSYAITETGDAGYNATYSEDCDSTGSISLSVGDVKSCTITNDDIAPVLHLRKTITNDNGGSAAVTDWTLTATGALGVPTNLSGTTPVDSGTDFKADTYTLNESGGPSGYDASDWDCEGDAINTGNTITLGLGEEATCIINNDDKPARIIVIKHVVITDGSFVNAQPSDFTMIINGVTVDGSNSFPGSDSGTNRTLTSIGSYYITETGPGGYKATYSAGCTGTIALGEEKICTVTNTAKPGRMTGGGSILAGVKITHGFELHCNTAALPNNLEINWNDKSGKSHKFHMTHLDSVDCSMSEGGSPAPPKNTANGFNKITGTATGIYDGKSGGSMTFTFTDFGEPGKNDTAKYTITTPFLIFFTNNVFSVGPTPLTQGNHQAHLY
jgi:hypothetical protein